MANGTTAASGGSTERVSRVGVWLTTLLLAFVVSGGGLMIYNERQDEARDNAPQTDAQCRQVYEGVLKHGKTLSTVDYAACGDRFQAWFPTEPPSQYELRGGAIVVDDGRLAIPLRMVFAQRLKSTYRRLSVSAPAIDLTFDNRTVELFFQTDAQADAAFQQISNAIAMDDHRGKIQQQ